jgi:hypothetical protein
VLAADFGAIRIELSASKALARPFPGCVGGRGLVNLSVASWPTKFLDPAVLTCDRRLLPLLQTAPKAHRCFEERAHVVGRTLGGLPINIRHPRGSAARIRRPRPAGPQPRWRNQKPRGRGCLDEAAYESPISGSCKPLNRCELRERNSGTATNNNSACMRFLFCCGLPPLLRPDEWKGRVSWK